MRMRKRRRQGQKRKGDGKDRGKGENTVFIEGGMREGTTTDKCDIIIDLKFNLNFTRSC